MALPIGGATKWPPANLKTVFDTYALNAAWYSGDPNQLAQTYARQTYNPFDPGAHFWARKSSSERRLTLHVPLAGDMAATSANLLFGEPPALTFATQQALDYWTDLADRIHWERVLLEAAETCAAMGGIYIKVAWDSTLFRQPILSICQPDCAVPDFKWGHLQAVTFWTVLENDGATCWRLLERHEPGVILTGLYEGSPDELGTRRSLLARDDTALLQDQVLTGLPGLAVVYVPNMLPNRADRGSSLGQSDYAGATTLLESLDEAYTCLIREIRLGKASGIIPEVLCDIDSSTGDVSFDIDREFWVRVPAALSADPLDNQIVYNQPNIRTQEILTACVDTMVRCIGAAGYSPQTFGIDITGQAESGTALNIRERKTAATMAKKAEYWDPAIGELVEMILTIDSQVFRSGAAIERPQVEISDCERQDPLELAQTANQMNMAQAASIETRVRTLHPDWEEDQVAAEVALITQETAPPPVPDVFSAGELP